MCIRDRAYPVLDLVLLLPLALLLRIALKLRGSHAGEVWVLCLLYTSDAADERSSVDLGGRRIIKKKKKTRSDSSMIEYRKIKRSNSIVAY